MKTEVKNLPASVHARLKNLAEERGKTFDELFYYYAIERFLYRFSKSLYTGRFVLKGGLMFFGWGIDLRRPTRDIDVQGYVENSIENLVSIVREICGQPVEPDGMRFDPDSVRGVRINDDADYRGIRVFFTGYLGSASKQLHLDVSFANEITPRPVEMYYPSLLAESGFPLLGYPFQTSIAEKFQAMVALGAINDRMKDFYDIWLLSQQVAIAGDSLAAALRATFQARRTELPEKLPVALTPEFAETRQPDWERFLNRSRLEINAHPGLVEAVSVIRELVWPAVQAARSREPFEKIWPAGGPWQRS